MRKLLLLLSLAAAEAWGQGVYVGPAYRVVVYQTLPAACRAGDVGYQNSDTTFYKCSPANTWTAFAGGAPASAGTRGLVFVIGDPGGSALAAASTTTTYLTVPFACTIAAYNLAIDAGTITVKFWKVATGTAIPTVSNSISTSGVSISTGTAIHSATVSDFTTTAVAANDIIAMNVTAVATAKYISATLQCTN